MIRNYTITEVRTQIQEICVKLLELNGNGVAVMDEALRNDPSRYMSKTLLAFEDSDLELIKKILPKVRNLVYVGKSGEISEAVKSYCVEKDIPLKLENTGIASSIEVYYNTAKSFEIYTSAVFSEIEIVAKLLAHFGPKITLLLKYVSQVFLGRTNLPFDHSSIRDLQDIDFAFLNYHNSCMEKNVPYDTDKLISIFTENKINDETYGK